jgi:hypothetical protein
MQTQDRTPTTTSTTDPTRTVLERFPAGGPRGSWPAEQFAHDRRVAGQPAEVVMDLRTDTFLVIVRGGA